MSVMVEKVERSERVDGKEGEEELTSNRMKCTTLSVDIRFDS